MLKVKWWGNDELEPKPRSPLSKTNTFYFIHQQTLMNFFLQHYNDRCCCSSQAEAKRRWHLGTTTPLPLCHWFKLPEEGDIPIWPNMNSQRQCLKWEGQSVTPFYKMFPFLVLFHRTEVIVGHPQRSRAGTAREICSLSFGHFKVLHWWKSFAAHYDNWMPPNCDEHGH